MTERRCIVTGNLCETDTWDDGCPCLCSECQKYLFENQKDLDPEFQRVIDKNFHLLI